MGRIQGGWRLDPERIAVIAGIGEVVNRSREPGDVQEPAEFMAQALSLATGDKLRGSVDSVEVVALTSWRYTNPAAEVCRRAGLQPRFQVNTTRGGDTPVRLLHEAALKVVAGEFKACAVVGAEATNARGQARRKGIQLQWTDLPSPDQSAKFGGLNTSPNPLAERYGLTNPSNIYPLYEMATQAAWQQSPAQANAISADLWAKYAAVAASNPFSWTPERQAAQEIGTIGPSNRLVNWPYPKLMIANPNVNMGSCFIVTTLAEARRAGIGDEDVIFIAGGASAKEPDDFLARDCYNKSSAQDAVLERTLQIVGEATRLTHLELYSCFPVVPKMALSTLSRLGAPDLPPTVTGGLSFFGGPMHNYMSHAICAMVRALRQPGAEAGLVYGQGGYVTKHHAVVLTRQHSGQELTPEYSVQRLADDRMGPIPELDLDYVGPATVETYTIQYERNGEADKGVVVLRTPTGKRLAAAVEATDRNALAVLQCTGQSAIGRRGQVTLHEHSWAVWSP